jgi:diguanylate cyclase (GGDEF)-like protein
MAIRTDIDALDRSGPGSAHVLLETDQIVMSDSATPPPLPEPIDPTSLANGDSVNGAAPQQLGPSPEPPAVQPEDADPGTRSGASPPSASRGAIERFSRGRTGAWAAVALVCVAAGAVGSVLGARAVASNDVSKTREAFNQTATGIASSLKVSVQREEDLTVSASTFYAGNPKALPSEFAKWAKWAQMLRHYPELDALGLVTQVRPPQLAAFAAKATGATVKPQAAGSTKPDSGALRIAPAGTRPYYCLAGAQLARSRADSSPTGLDYCALTPALISSRDTARSVEESTTITVPVSGRRVQAVRVETPVYRGGQPPITVAGRRAAFVGWLSKVLFPGAIARTALHAYPQNGVSLRYRAGSATVTSTSGRRQSGAQSASVALHNGWKATVFGASVNSSVWADGKALMGLLGGILLSAMLGVLVFLLGDGVGGANKRRAPSAEREPSNEQLYDPLTGLPNRALTLDLAERMVARTRRQPGMLAGALVIDIDWFKDVNDKLGQACGDQLLKIVAERVSDVVRSGDTVGRLEGDEFVVLVEAAARGARLDALARRVIEALHKPVDLDDFGPSFFLTASIGLAFGQYAHPEDLLRDAQLALHAGKAAGKDRYTLFNANMRSVIEGQGALEAELNTALLDNQFFQLYQPIYDLDTRQVVGLEALIRWRHPTRGVLAAAEFVPLAEETGLIVPIGRWALEEACRRAAEWNVAGHRASISVQVSTNQLNRDGFTTDVRRALQQSGLEPSLLTLEIGETTVLLDVAAATERCREIKQLGVRIAIDDFGSGYAYRSDLQQMPIDFLKVDRSSLAASDDQDYRSWLLEAILHFGRDLALTVIAKGIDTHEHMTTVQSMGCTLAQGFYMGEPTPAHVVEGLLDADFQASRANIAG